MEPRTVGEEEDAEVLGGRQRSLLLVLSQREISREMLGLAIEAAHALGARLHLLHVVPHGSGLGERRRLIAESLRLVQRELAAQSAARGRSDGAPVEDLVASIAVLSGNLVQQTAAYSAAIDATLIIIARVRSRARDQAAAVASAAQRPVLIPFRSRATAGPRSSLPSLAPRRHRRAVVREQGGRVPR